MNEYAAFLASSDGLGDCTPPDSDFGPGELVDEADALTAALADHLGMAGEPDHGFASFDAWAAADTTPARLHCERCGHDWRCRRGRTPKRCSRCTSPRWAMPRPVPLPGNTCVHCGYRWTPRRAGHSPACPACHTTLWDGRTDRRTARQHNPTVQEQIGLDTGAAAAQAEYEHACRYREPYPHVGSTNPLRQAWLASYAAHWARLQREDAAAGRAA